MTNSVRQNVIELILEITKQGNAFDLLEQALAKMDKETLGASLLKCGIIPERFDHDSSEEKLWAKYCDILLAKSWTALNIPAEVLRARGDSADVFGRTDAYTIVGDAKAFRLSRTAKNQKDFKIQALDDWRKSNTYALLVSPLFQYPNRQSQIYQQAIERNVTLLSYVHFRFLLIYFDGQDLSALWRIGEKLAPSKTEWDTIDDTVCQIIEMDIEALSKFKLQAIEETRKIGEEGINYWQSRIEAYQQLSQEEAVARLVKAEKIEARINTIKRAMQISLEV
ncbi:MAG TPA: HindIII family type II restriction endonuclease [Anaerolineales bacterium]|nr:HindIII family type II restriction endonuclease [Anaerolineales bacterium]